MLTPMAWAFTHVCGYGVWRYLKNVDEVISPRFFIVSLRLFDYQTIIHNNMVK